MASTEDNNYIATLRNFLDSRLGKYAPVSVDIDNLAKYLYKVYLTIFRDANFDYKEELKRVGGVINPMDEEAVEKALRDMTLIASQKFMEQTLKETYSRLRNSVPMVEVSRSTGSVVSASVTTPTTKNISYEGNFDGIIDLSAGQLDDATREARRIAEEKSREEDEIRFGRGGQQTQKKKAIGTTTGSSFIDFSDNSLMADIGAINDATMELTMNQSLGISNTEQEAVGEVYTERPKLTFDDY